ncbi:DUF1329 domain-containing protein [Variovorax sp. WS11]|uniref:DUF1329 domain-containing protein n=1 Tax=Variovorax sp. WS11 TaxID=1105204 RepID=UPI000D0D6288|nr:DUF1329 domain-containing protein [Variovorax sp. WS11]NDZ18009.1 DUF1329 domain-containing protein [Variovorax sp. WS11]PSL84908.1 DUF1329 domain-containing protein [Variovorax sp. WS11]
MKKFARWSACALALAAGLIHAGVTPEEAKQLGTTLTPWGAEIAGNKDGTIPPYTGGLRKAPPDYQPGSGFYPDPYKDDKPLFTITSKNMAEHAEKLTEGQKALLTRYPDYRMDIYPTHRSAAMPQSVIDATVKNATRAQTTGNGLGITGAEGGLPFPVPKNGYEVMWNHLLAYSGEVVEFTSSNYYVDRTGRRTLTGTSNMRYEYPYYQADNPERNSIYLKQNTNAIAPAALAGQQFILVDPLDFTTADRRAWQYVPGQRRVKVAPELAYDTPYSAGAGMVTFDDIGVFSGRMDRYAFKLLGKKEMYLPYNAYKLYLSQQTNDLEKGMAVTGTPKFLNPDYMRWELHRVWVVEAELLDGKRHLYKKRVFYWDEDNPGTGMSDQYDNADKLFRVSMSLPIQLYDKDIAYALPWLVYDLSNNVYVMCGMAGNGPLRAGLNGPGSAPTWTKRDWSPESMAARGVR